MEFSRIIHGLLKYGNIVEDRNYFMGASPHRPDVAGKHPLAAGRTPVGNRAPFCSYYKQW